MWASLFLGFGNYSRIFAMQSDERMLPAKLEQLWLAP
jgi:hypothetical protein